jgi:hypothetical protein
VWDKLVFQFTNFYGIIYGGIIAVLENRNDIFFKSQVIGFVNGIEMMNSWIGRFYECNNIGCTS